MKSRVRESRTHGSVRGWHREVPVYSTGGKFYVDHIWNNQCSVLCDWLDNDCKA